MKDNKERINELREERHKLAQERTDILVMTMRYHLSNKMAKLQRAKVESIDRNLERINKELYDIDPEEKVLVDSKKNEEDVNKK